MWRTFLQMLEETQALHVTTLAINTAVRDGLYIVDQVVIDIVDAKVFKLFIDERIQPRLLCHIPMRQFRRDHVAVAWITFRYRFAKSVLALAIVVHVAGVKIVVAAGEKGIGHLFHRFDIDGPILHRQAHEAEAQFSDLHKVQPPFVQTKRSAHSASHFASSSSCAR